LLFRYLFWFCLTLFNSDFRSFPDVWREPNIAEAKLIELPLTQFMIRLRLLLNEYPEHPMLVQLVRITHRVSSIPSNSPVMKMLAGVELLLKKAEEYEKAAPRSLSISKQLTKLTLLVARWRKMELHSWPKALADRELYFRQKALKLWPHIYSLIQVDVDALSGAGIAGLTRNRDEEIEGFFGRLYTALIEFINMSSLGELPTRLHILSACHHQLQTELAYGGEIDKSLSAEQRKKEKEQRALKSRISSVLANLHLVCLLLLHSL
jgi:midasin (ATPase involved in ribosome maturation)